MYVTRKHIVEGGAEEITLSGELQIFRNIFHKSVQFLTFYTEEFKKGEHKI